MRKLIVPALAIAMLALGAFGASPVGAVINTVADQQQTYQPLLVTGDPGPTNIAQSFTAGYNADLTRVDFRVCASGLSATLKIYQGPSTAGTVLHSQALAPLPSPCFTFVLPTTSVTLTSGVPITAGNQYTFAVEMAGPACTDCIVYAVDDTDIYTAGESNRGPLADPFDLWFRTFISQGPYPADSAPLQLDQEHLNFSQGEGTPAHDIGQSFTAGVDGLLARVGVTLCAAGNLDGAGDPDFRKSVNDSPVLEIREGDGLGGNLLYRQPTLLDPAQSCSLFGPGMQMLDLANTVPVASGNQYTFSLRFEPSNQINTLMAFGSYAGGQAYLNGGPRGSGAALRFQTYVIVPDPDEDGVCAPGLEEVEGLDCSGSDSCPTTPAGAAVDANGCTPEQLQEQARSDPDRDGVCSRGTTSSVCEGTDRCPNTPAGAEADENGCSAAQVDSDLDGFCNRGVTSGLCQGSDRCANTAAGAEVDENGCSRIQVDSNLDGKCNRGVTSIRWCSNVILLDAPTGTSTVRKAAA